MAPIADEPWTGIAAAIAAATGSAFRPDAVVPAAGGCINDAVSLEGGGQRYFVKTNRPHCADMLAAERRGLEELAATGALRVPLPVVDGVAGDVAFIAMEHIPMTGLSRAGWARAGEALARLHGVSNHCFGWHRSNTIGTTLQVNDPSENWVDFYRDCRLGVQLELAGRNGLDPAALRQGERLMGALDAFFAGYAPAASLLHGDLWGGNIAAGPDAEPVVFDPAVYFGDREADIAMTELFGSFDRRFYDAYRAAWPLDAGYRRRRTLYNLYHVLNHFNLFGGAYGRRAGRMISELLADCG